MTLGILLGYLAFGLIAAALLTSAYLLFDLVDHIDEWPRIR